MVVATVMVSVQSAPSISDHEILTALIQMDETVVNGAQGFYSAHFGLNQTGPGSSRNRRIVFLVNSAPYVRSLFDRRIAVADVI